MSTRTAPLTDKQKAVLIALSDRTGALTTNELTRLVNSPHHDDDFPEIPTLDNTQVRAVGAQLVARGLVVEEGYLNTMRNWSITNLGRQRVALVKGEL